MKQPTAKIRQNNVTIVARFKRGSLLLELLIAIALLAGILAVGSQALFVSLQSGKISGERDVAMGLASEALETVRGVSEESWQNIYNLSKSPTHYYATSTVLLGTLALLPGDETIPLNNAIYTRYIVIDDVCRDDITRDIVGSAPCAVGSSADPSSEKVSVVVSWPKAEPINLSEYFFRWRNKVCNQTDWSGGVGSGAKNCPDTTYGSVTAFPAGTINATGGTLKLQQ